MTSSPDETPHARIASWSASVPEPTPIACADPQYAAHSLSKRLHVRTDGELHALEDLIDRGADLVADRRVLRAQIHERDVLRGNGHVAAPSFSALSICSR